MSVRMVLVSHNANPGEPGADPEGPAQLARYGAELADGIERALPSWVEGSVARLMTAYRGSVDDEVAAEAIEAGRRARAEVGPQVRGLLEADLDEQWTNPLALVRRAVRYPTEVLRRAGVPGVVRDEQAERQFPDDPYDLTPTRFADLDPHLHDLGLRWGAAKAFVARARHRDLGPS
jgi:hypothetical protein